MFQAVTYASSECYVEKSNVADVAKHLAVNAPMITASQCRKNKFGKTSLHVYLVKKFFPKCCAV